MLSIPDSFLNVSRILTASEISVYYIRPDGTSELPELNNYVFHSELIRVPDGVSFRLRISKRSDHRQPNT